MATCCTSQDGLDHDVITNITPWQVLYISKVCFLLIKCPRDRGWLSLSLFFYFFFFLGLHLQHIEVLRLGVKSELQLQASATATATQDPSHMATYSRSLT